MGEYVPSIIGFVSAIMGAYITVRVAMAEMKKDIKYLSDKIDGEIESKKEGDIETRRNMQEVRDDVKSIFKVLTNIQIELAKTQSQGDILSSLKDALSGQNTNNPRTPRR